MCKKYKTCESHKSAKIAKSEKRVKCAKCAKHATNANQLIRESVRKRVSSQGINQTESLVS